MKRIVMTCLFLIISVNLVLFINCDKNSTKYTAEDLVGKWEATEETIDLSAVGAGKLVVSQGNAMFINLIIEVMENDSVTYETWTGTDKTAEDADYEVGSGFLTTDGSAFTLEFNSATLPDLEGTYKFKNLNKVIFNTRFVLADIGTDPVPVNITIERIRE